MKRRILSVLMIIMLLCSSMVVTSYADTENISEQIPEAVVLVQVDNVECKMIQQMTDLSVVVKLEDGTVVSKVPVERVQEEEGDMVALWLGYSFEEIDADIKAQLAEFQKDFHLGSLEEILEYMIFTDEDSVNAMAMALEKISSRYVIEITGIPESDDHEFKIETDTVLITSTLVKELFDLAKELLGEMLQIPGKAMDEITTIQGLIDEVVEFFVREGVLKEGQDFYDLLDMLFEEPLTDEEKAQIAEYIVKADETLAYLQSEDYTGTVFAGVYLECECPYTVTFTIFHQYYKEVDGKMTIAGTANFGPLDESEILGEDWYDYDFEKYYYEGLSGDVIRAADYIHPEFNGETYEYVGSYDEWTLIYPDEEWFFTDYKDFDTFDELYNCEDWWTEYKFDEYVLGSDDIETPFGLVLRYELMEDPADVPADQDDVNDADGSPETGDDSNMTPFYVIMVLAMAVMATAVVTRRRQTN